MALGLNRAFNWRLARRKSRQQWSWVVLLALGYAAAQWAASKETFPFGAEGPSHHGGYLLPIGCLIVIWCQIYTEFPPKDSFSACELQPLLPDAKDEACALCRSALSSNSIITLPCGHHYHRQCVRTWQQHSTVCLLCYRIHSSSRLSKAI